MVRRSLVVCATIALSLFAFPNASSARATSRASQQKRSAACNSCSLNSTKSSTALRSKKNARAAANAPCHAKNYLDPRVAGHYKTAVREMKRQGIKPKVTSLWRSSDYQAQLHKCSNTASCRRAHPGLYYALPPGKSLHEAGFAVDISGVAAGPRGKKHLTPQGKKIVAVMRKNGFNWRYRLADPAHFEADPRKHGYRNAKQAIAHTQATCDVKLARLAKNTSQKKAISRASLRSASTVKTQLSSRRPEPRSTRRAVKGA